MGLLCRRLGFVAMNKNKERHNKMLSNDVRTKVGNLIRNGHAVDENGRPHRLCLDGKVRREEGHGCRQYVSARQKL